MPGYRALFDQAFHALQSGDDRQAERLLREVLAQRPGHAETLYLLGVICAQSGRPEEGIPLIRQAVALKPYFFEAKANLGAALVATVQSAEAVQVLREALALKPDHVPSLHNLGRALHQQGAYAEALAAYRRAAQLQPDFADAHHWRGIALMELGETDEALDAIQTAIARRPDSLDSLNALANLLREIGRIPEAASLYERLLARPDLDPVGHSNALLTLNALPAADPADVFQRHLAWSRRHAPPALADNAPFPNDRDPDRPLRVGYVSPDLHTHPVAYFLEPLLEAHDRARVHAVAYADVHRPDATTARLRQHVVEWVDAAALSPAQLAARIRQDRIDILVDLAGHTANHRLLTFARRPAPIQVSWLGYPNTTGLAAINYRLTDARADPPGAADALHTETLIRLPDTFLCYRPPADAPDVAPPPARAAGHITFGSFNAALKINAPLLDLWAQILAAVPGSRLLLKSRHIASRAGAARIAAAFSARGVDPQRVEALRHAPSTRQHLELYSRIDLALDTFPYHGTTTTCETLWMGVPVLTLAGASHVSRVGVSLLTTAGLQDFIAQDRDDYVARAVRFAGELPALAALRETLRDRLRASPLCDAPRFARHVEAAYRSIWQTWCTQHPTRNT